MIEDGGLRSNSLILVRSGRRGVKTIVGDGYSPVWGRGGIAFVRKGAGEPQLLLLSRLGRRPYRLLTNGDGVLYPVGWSADGRRLLVAQGTNPQIVHALLLTPGSRTVQTLPPALYAVEALSHDGRLVLGEMGGNVVSVNIDGTVSVLAHDATVPSWTR